MKKAFDNLVHTAKGRHCQVMPFTGDFKHSMGAQLTTRLNDIEYLEQNQNNGLQDFKSDTEMVGQVTKNKTDAEIEASIVQFSNQDLLLSQRLRDIPAQKFQIETCQQMLAQTIKINNPNVQNPQWKLTDSRIRYTKNSDGEFFVNLCFSVFAYQNTAAPMQGYCLTDRGKMIELDTNQFTELTARDNGNKSEFLNYANQQLHQNLVPIIEIRARIKMKPGVENAMVYEYVDLTLAINHETLSYDPLQTAFEELDTERTFRTQNYHQLEEEDQASIDSDKPATVISFTDVYRQQFSQRMTTEFNDADYLETNKDHAFRDFKRDTQMMGQNTHLQEDSVIAESIESFSNRNALIARQLRDISGQDYQLMMRRHTVGQCLRVNNIPQEDIQWCCEDPITRYTKNSRGEFFINLEYQIYAYRLTTGKMEGYCLSDQGKLIELPGNHIQQLRGNNRQEIQENAMDLIHSHVVPLAIIRARVKLTPNSETNTVEYDCVEMKVAINHPNISYVPIQQPSAELDTAHQLKTTDYYQIEKDNQATTEFNMPCQVIPFTQEFRNTLAAEYTQTFNSERYLHNDHEGYKDLNRNAEIVGEVTRNKSNEEKRAAIRRYSGRFDLVSNQLEHVSGQTYIVDLQKFIMQELRDTTIEGFADITLWDDPVTQYRYTTDENGHKYLNLQMNVYSHIHNGEYHCLTDQGVMENLDYASVTAEKERSEQSLRDQTAPKPNIIPILCLRARIKLQPEESSKQLVYEIPELELAINHPGIQLSEAGKRALNFNAIKRSADPYEVYRSDQAIVESDIAGYAKFSTPPVDLPPPQPKPTATPVKANTGFFNTQLQKDSDVEDAFNPISTVPDFDTSEQDDGPPPQGGRNVRRRYAAPEDMNRDQYHLLNEFQKTVVRSAHQHSSLRYNSHDANSVTLRDAENPAATTDQYDVKVTGNGDQWRIQSSHLESSTKLTNALIQSNPATIITIVSKRGPQNDIASIKNDLEALIRLTAQGTLVDIAEHKMDYLKTHLNDQSIIQEMKSRFSNDGDLTHFMSQITDSVPLHAFIDAIFTRQSDYLYQATNSLRPGM